MGAGALFTDNLDKLENQDLAAVGNNRIGMVGSIGFSERLGFGRH